MADPKPDLEAQLAALKAKREANHAAREEARREQRLAAEIAKQERAIVDDETYAKLQDEHGADYLRRVNTPFGMVVVKAPEPIVYDRYMDKVLRADHPNPKVRTSFSEETQKLARLCVVYPTRPEFDALCNRVSGLYAVAANEATDLGKAQAADDTGK